MPKLKEKYIYIMAGMLFLLISCKPLPPFTNKTDLIGTWHCKTMEITTPKHQRVFFRMQLYGYASFILNADSSYSFSMDIERDVVLEKEAFGNTYSKIIMQAGYKNFRKGYYYVTDSSITFSDADKNRIEEESYTFNERILLTKFLDRDNKLWRISWIKED